eukprot:CAMPEP_0195584992 /NCGR_PEP_ID=MMETSP0814-20130614/26825_1 /TAXON_ID=97485 /ORGANISM="Prymnesium parvum, Strain Texoma1" /LENGTH=72 /DNA_ID=CAMNT_0040723207 /DNA_START=39 /DNA_END=253 /DNA_ORIENTATION=-
MSHEELQPVHRDEPIPRVGARMQARISERCCHWSRSGGCRRIGADAKTLRKPPVRVILKLTSTTESHAAAMA